MHTHKPTELMLSLQIMGTVIESIDCKFVLRVYKDLEYSSIVHSSPKLLKNIFHSVSLQTLYFLCLLPHYILIKII